MDWNAAIERHRDTLKRILAALIAMAGLADCRSTMPRQLHRAVLRLLRPAEAAARRLIIAQARGLVVALRDLGYTVEEQAPARAGAPWTLDVLVDEIH